MFQSSGCLCVARARPVITAGAPGFADVPVPSMGPVIYCYTCTYSSRMVVTDGIVSSQCLLAVIVWVAETVPRDCPDKRLAFAVVQ